MKFKSKKYLQVEKIKNYGFINNDVSFFNKKKLKICCLTLVTALISTFSANSLPKNSYYNPGINCDNSFVVAHAGGSLDIENKQRNYLNCVESFYKHYSAGTKMFEYDFVFSKDGKLVGIHKFEYHKDFSLSKRIPYTLYNNIKILNSFTGMTEDILFKIISEYSDCKFIIDTKEKEPIKIYERIIHLANIKNINISKSIIPFVSSKEMLEEIEKLYSFDEIMFTNYKKFYTTNQILEIIDSCKKIKYLHIFPIDFFRIDIDKINCKGIRVFAHMDKEDKLKIALNYGCTGIFSDNITENEFKENYYYFVLSKLQKFNNKEEILPIKKEKIIEQFL